MLKKILLLVLLILIAVALCTPLREIDFFWHLATGNWIIDAGTLPTHDPFSYTATNLDARDLLVLKGYWLAQILYACLWKVLGAAGVVGLKVTILGLLLYVVYRSARRCGINSWFSLLAMAPILLDLRLPLTNGIRPQQWSFLFAAYFIYLLDGFTSNNNTKKVVLLCCTAALWSNLHPGVMLGGLIVVIYLVGDLGRSLIAQGRRSWFLLVPVLLAVVLNPAGVGIYSQLWEMLIPNKEMAIYQSANLDGSSLLSLLESGIFESFGFAVVLLLCLLTILFKLKKMRLEHLALIGVLTMMSFMRARYMIFLTIIGVQVTFPYWKNELEKLSRKLVIEKLLPYCVGGILALSSFLIFQREGSAFSQGALDETLYPKGAVQFLKATRPNGKLFNAYEWGGYLMVFLPEYKVYIDGRGLGANSGTMIEYKLIRGALSHQVMGKPVWRNLLDQHGIGVVLTIRDDPDGFTALNDALMQDPEWSLAYQDYLSDVFIRKDGASSPRE